MRHSDARAARGDIGSGGRESRGQQVAFLLLAAIAVGLLAYSCAGPAGNTGGQGDAVEQDGAARTGSGGQIVVNQTSVIDALAPGKPPDNLEGTITNLGTAPVYVRSVAAVITATSRPSCSIEEFVIGGSPARVDAQIAPGVDRGSWSGLTVRLRNRPVNQDACKNTRVTIEYSAN